VSVGVSWLLEIRYRKERKVRVSRVWKERDTQLNMGAVVRKSKQGDNDEM
jgi:hypothetical protein